jgi:hypothetical protein
LKRFISAGGLTKPLSTSQKFTISSKLITGSQEAPPPGLDNAQLATLRDALNLRSAQFRYHDLECLEVAADGGINFKVFEDGLVVLNHNHSTATDLGILFQTLTEYYEQRLSPALSYLFSLGAPNPRELTNIQTSYPFFIVLNHSTTDDMQQILSDFQQTPYFEVNNEHFDIMRGDQLYIINNKSERLDDIEWFIEEQIFLREFKGRLHHYLNLHRTLWEKIDTARGTGKLSGKQIARFGSEIAADDKTITLVDTRIQQMGVYLKTRENIAKHHHAFQDFEQILEHRYETMADTLKYMEGVWAMTRRYVASAKEQFSSIQAEMTNKSIEGLTVITSIGVGGTIVGIITSAPPDFEELQISSIFYVIGLAALGFSMTKILQWISARRKYSVED